MSIAVESMLTGEKLFPFNELPKRLPKRNGRTISLATIYRWRNAGLAGVRIEVVYVGGVAYTSLEALDRFNHAVTQAKTPTSLRNVASEAQVARAHSLAKSRLVELRNARSRRA